MAHYEFLNIRKSFGEREILRGVDIRMDKGERLGLVGINGCGKTTLLKILAGLEQQDGGQIQMPKNCTAGLLEQETRDESGQQSFLSGGERSLAAIRRLLADPPDLLLLDEPTNNLDFQGIQFVAHLLQECSGSMIIVSHDRYFLDEMVSRVIEIENGRAVEYAGNYSFYRDEKEKLFQERLHRYQVVQKEQQRIREAITEKQHWAEKAHRDSTRTDTTAKMGRKEYKRAKAMKLDKKAKNDIRRLERLMQEGEARPEAESKIQFAFAGSERHGRRILEAAGLAKSFGTHTLFSPSSFYILRQEKIAVFGPNGCGKTTLVRLIQGLDTPTEGQLWLSPNLHPYVLEQSLENLPAGTSLLCWLTGRLGRMDGEIRAHLAQLGFTRKILEQDISGISQGEQMKLKLLEPILMHCELIILDEPTNYLDLHAREMLEQALTGYGGTLLVVSHDLYLLQQVCDKVLLFDGGQIRRIESSFLDYSKTSAFG